MAFGPEVFRGVLCFAFSLSPRRRLVCMLAFGRLFLIVMCLLSRADCDPAGLFENV